MSERVPVQVGQVWGARDRRDARLRVTVLAVTDDRVQIQRFVRTWVRLDQFGRDYEWVR